MQGQWGFCTGGMSWCVVLVVGMHRRSSSKGGHDRGQLLSNVNSQLQQYKQRMQLLHQQLIMGQQKMKEVQGQQPPQPQLVAQYQRKLQQGIQQYRQLEVCL